MLAAAACQEASSLLFPGGKTIPNSADMFTSSLIKVVKISRDEK